MRMVCVTDHAITIRSVDLLDPAHRSDAARWIEVHANVQREIFGDEGSAAEISMPLTDNLTLANLWLSVDPAHRRRGCGSALLADAQQIGADHQRTTFMVESEGADGAPDLAEGFATLHGYATAQTMVRSALALAAGRDGVNGILEVRDEYAVESVVDHLPDGWLDDRALLQQRMSTDAPVGDLALEEEAWDVERLRASDARTQESGPRIVESVARHTPSGRLVAFTRVSISAAEPTLAHQQDTLVLREHRGHALGLRLKTANARLLMGTLPQVTSVRTWNAVSNEPMLAVNRRLGYLVDGGSRERQKVMS